MGATKQQVVKISPECEGQVTYEVIKKEDIEGAFRDALLKVLEELVSRINSLINTVTATAPKGLWVWDFTSRWDYDQWW
jgi:hypothetical protein